MEYFYLVPSIILILFTAYITGNYENMKEFIIVLLTTIIISSFVAFSLLGVIKFIKIKQAEASTTITASVGLTEANIWTTYLANKDKFDKCLK